MPNKRKKFIYSLILLAFAKITIAASFIATVDDNAIAYGQSIQLKLQLEDAKAVAGLDLSPLAKDFTIYHQQQYSSYINTNGSVKAETGWNVTLMPRGVGEYYVPALGIKTDKGILASEPIKVTVQKVRADGSKPTDTVGISMVATVNKAKMFVNEPVICTLKIISYKPIANLTLDDIKSSNAIVEKLGEPKQYMQTLGGVRAQIVELNFAVTALKPGKITISPATLSGELQIPIQAQRTQRFGLFNNMFHDNMFEFKPFSLQSEEIELQVLPAPVTMKNWLPANNISLSQSWDTVTNVKVGDTITRKVKINAKGVFAKQLPSIKEFIPQDGIKVYANKPVFNDKHEPSNNTISSSREEEYSIVPQAAGPIVFPEIEVKWWNLATNKLETSTLPAKTIQVLPAATNPSANVTLDYSEADEPQEIAATAPQTEKSAKPTLFYTILGAAIGIVLTLLLVGAGLLIRKARRKVRVRKQHAPVVITNCTELRQVILQYSIKHWQAPNNITLNRLGESLTKQHYLYDLPLYAELSQHINTSIYAQETVAIEQIISVWESFKASVHKDRKKHTSSKQDVGYTTLNPT